MQVVACEALAPAEEAQLDQELDADDLPAELLDEVEDRLHRAARGEHVVMDEDACPAREGVRVHLERILAVLERVGGADRAGRQLPRSARSREPAAEPVREGAAEDEPAGLG